ncbi:hypothetical protein [Neotabrizicola sp. sgz301269]|uniref:NYN domain-containing protein n=1 Tax=Neotabrizicola sp. sgz301269 TaxID=3276282 RepID=UPI00376FC31E
MSDGMLLGLFAGGLLAILLLLDLRRRLRARSGRAPKQTLPLAVLDGSNVMHWGGDKPDLATVAAVMRLAEARGYVVGVIFDANAGYLLVGRYLHEAALARALGVKTDAVFVVPKGRQADPYLLDHARATGAILVSNDRFRDLIADYPELAVPGRRVPGGVSEGKVWVNLPDVRKLAA